MPSVTRTAGGTKVMLWSDGEAVSHDDLNISGDLLSIRSLDYVLFQKMALSVPFYLDDDVETHLGSATDVLLRAYTLGGGAMFATSGAQTSKVYGGIIATYVNAARPIVPDTLPDPTTTYGSGVRMFYVPESTGGSAVNFTHSLNPGVTDRIDAVTIKIEEVVNLAEDQVTRDFKDATTGAITSSTTYKRRATRATFTMYEGIDMTIAGSIPTGEQLLYTVTMPSGSGSIAQQCDWTHPIGKRLVSYAPPAVCSVGQWDSGDIMYGGVPTAGTEVHIGSFAGTAFPVGHGSIRTPTGGLIQYIFPPSGGDPCARLLGFRVSYKIYTGGAIELVRLTETSETVICDLAALATFDGANRAMVVHCDGDPRPENFNGGFTGTLGPVVIGSNGVLPFPIWMHGDYKRTFNLPIDGGGNPYTIALKVTGGAPGGSRNYIFGTQWIVAQGG